jgi:hypothetical protein
MPDQRRSSTGWSAEELDFASSLLCIPIQDALETSPHEELHSALADCTAKNSIAALFVPHGAAFSHDVHDCRICVVAGFNNSRFENERIKPTGRFEKHIPNNFQVGGRFDHAISKPVFRSQSCLP